MAVNGIEAALLESLAARIAKRRGQQQVRPCRVWGHPPRLLLHGYLGAGNIGAEVRTGEIVRQIHAIFGREKVQLAYTSRRPLELEPFSSIAREPADSDVGELLTHYDGVIVCEGSLFKSNFANALAISLVGALGVAAVEGKLSVAYGAEVGTMDPPIARFAQDCCQESLLLARSAASHRRFKEELGLAAVLGADTAWTFEPASAQVGLELLRRAGWDGVSNLVCVAPVNPFWWPVRPDLEKAAALEATGRYQDLHYRSLFFHHDSEAARQQYSNYIDALASAVAAFCHGTGAFPVVVGMEELDRRACFDLQARLGDTAPVFLSGDYSPQQVVSILRQAFVVVSSRYHGLVTSMPGGAPGIGVSMDERIQNLLVECGSPECVLSAADPDLADALSASLSCVARDHAGYVSRIAPFVRQQLIRMAGMGRALCDVLETRCSGFERPTGLVDTLDYLPPLDAGLATLLDDGTEGRSAAGTKASLASRRS